MGDHHTLQKAMAMKKQRKGLWSPEEDQRLKDYILHHGVSCWSSLPINAGLQRNGKSCRLRWINYLRPGLKRGMFSTQEEEVVLTLHRTLGNKWAQIAKHLPGRTDNEIKNYWNSYLKKRASESGETKVDYTDPKLIKISKTEEDDSYVNITSKVSRVELESLTSEDQVTMNNTNLHFHPKQEHESFLPRLVFADWLTMNETDTQHGQIYQPTSSRNGFDYASEKQEDCVQEFMYNAGSSRSSAGELIIDQGLMDLPLKFQDESKLSSGFMDFSHVDVDLMYSEFYTPTM